MTHDFRPDTEKPKPIYRGMHRAALDAAYNNTAAVADSAQWLARWTEASAKLREKPAARLDIPYGKRPRARLDYLPSQRSRAPLFLHGVQKCDGRQRTPPVTDLEASFRTPQARRALRMRRWRLRSSRRRNELLPHRPGSA